MRSPSILVVPAVLLLLFTACGGSEDGESPEVVAANRDPLEGAWSRVEVTNADGSVVAAQPGLRIFVDGHFSNLFETGTEPRPPMPDSTGTAAEFRAVYGPITINTGTYELVGDTIVSRIIAAKNPATMAPDNLSKITYRIAGDTAWMSQVATQAGPVAEPNMVKFVRARAGQPSPLDGAWSRVETVRGPDLVSDQPGLRLFIDGHSSNVRVEGTEPRPLLPDSTGTAAEVMAAYGPFTGAAGTYEVSGDTITERRVVTINPAGMAPGNFAKITWRIVGDTLWLSQVANQAGPLAAPTVTKSVRVR